MKESSITMCRSVAAVVLFSVGAGLASAATPGPKCTSGARKGAIEVSVAGLTSDGRLVCFKRRHPGNAREIGYVSGLTGADTRLVGIDYRVQDGFLYGVGNGGGVYRIDTDSAAAVLVNRLTETLTGTAFGVDFNPAADRLRIIGNDGQNLRHNVNVGGTTLADGALNYAPGVAATGLTGAAYTNNDIESRTATTLFDIDTALDQVALQSPPNAGSLAATGQTGVDASSDVGFDIYSRVVSGRVQSNLGFAVLSSGDVAVLQREPADREDDLHGALRYTSRRHRRAGRSVAPRSCPGRRRPWGARRPGALK